MSYGAWGLLAGFIVAPAPVDSSTVPPFLTWDAPPSCPSQHELVELVEAYRSEDETTGGVQATGRVTQQGDALSLDLVVDAGDGPVSQSITHHDCQRLADAAALKIAMALDEAVLPEPAPEPEPEPKTDEPSDSECPICPPVAPKMAPAALPESPRRLRAAIYGGAGVDWGTLPGVGPHVEVGLGLHARHWALTAFGQYVWPREFWLEDDPEAGGVLMAGAAGVRGGPAFAVGPVVLHALGGMTVGAVRARGLGRSRSVVHNVFRASLNFGPALAWRPGEHIGLWASADLHLPLRYYSFSLPSRGVVYEARRVALQAAIATEIRF